MPGGGGQLIINLHEAELRHWSSPTELRHRVGPIGFQGVLTYPIVIDTDQKRDVCGVAFQHGGCTAHHSQPATLFVDSIVDAVRVIGKPAHDLRDALRRMTDADRRIDEIEAFLLDHLQPRPPEDELLRQVTDELMAGAAVVGLRRRLGLSQGRLHGLFKRRIGILPKLFARIERFASALGSVADRQAWSDLAHAHGFADQAHFIREFHVLSGYPPTSLQQIPGEPRHARAPTDKIFNTTSSRAVMITHDP